MPHSLHLPGETDDQFAARAKLTARIARILIAACLDNRDVQALIADPDLPHHTEASFRRYPTVRIDYAEAFAIAGIGEGLAVTKSKYWGDGPNILPLERDDPVDHWRILYVYKETSRYNRRFKQRQVLKRLLGRQYRPLVVQAKYLTKQNFVPYLTPDQVRAVRSLLGLEPGLFWRAVKGKVFLELPRAHYQLQLFDKYGDPV